MARQLPPPLPPPPPPRWQRPELPTLPGIGVPPGGTEPPPSTRTLANDLRRWFRANWWILVLVLGGGGYAGLLQRLGIATTADVAAAEKRCEAAVQAEGKALRELVDGGAVDSVARDGGAVDSEARQGINGAAADARSARASLERVQRLIGVDAGPKE